MKKHEMPPSPKKYDALCLGWITGIVTPVNYIPAQFTKIPAEKDRRTCQAQRAVSEPCCLQSSITFYSGNCLTMDLMLHI